MFKINGSLNASKNEGGHCKGVISVIKNTTKDGLDHIYGKEVMATKHNRKFLQHVTGLLCTNVSFCNYLCKKLFDWLKNGALTWCSVCKARENGMVGF